MASIRFVTPRLIAHLGDNHHRRLVLAVRVLDSFTGELARVRLQVSLTGPRRLRPLLSLGGLFCFEELLDQTARPEEQPAPGSEEYTLVVQPDSVSADWFYLQPRPNEAWSSGFARTIRLPKPDPLAPVEEVTLAPKRSYPFPPNATLARGQVTGGSGDPPAAAGVIVSCNYNQVDPQDSDRLRVVQIETQTDHAGEYVLFFQRLPGKRQQVTVTASKDGQSDQQRVVIAEGITQKVETLRFP